MVRGAVSRDSCATCFAPAFVSPVRLVQVLIHPIEIRWFRAKSFTKFFEASQTVVSRPARITHIHNVADTRSSFRTLLKPRAQPRSERETGRRKRGLAVDLRRNESFTVSGLCRGYFYTGIVPVGRGDQLTGGGVFFTKGGLHRGCGGGVG